MLWRFQMWPPGETNNKEITTIARRFYPNTPPAQSGPRINERIESDSVRLVDETGENVGVVSLDDALDRAEDAGLGLVETTPEAKPPVCKILDYGKYKYEAQKKANEARKKQKVIS